MTVKSVLIFLIAVTAGKSPQNSKTKTPLGKTIYKLESDFVVRVLILNSMRMMVKYPLPTSFSRCHCCQKPRVYKRP